MGPGCGTARQSKHGRPFNLQHCGLRFDLLQHLAQELLRQVLEPSVIEVVMGPQTTGLMEKDASLIEFGRELFSKHVVAAGTCARVVKVFGERDCGLGGGHGPSCMRSHYACGLRSASAG